MRDYMELLRDGREHQRPVRSIVWHTLEPTEITVERHEKWAGLQLADAVTSAYFNAVEPNLYGNYESRYADILRCIAIRKSGVALNFGVVPVPGLAQCRPNAHQLAFFRSFA